MTATDMVMVMVIPYADICTSPPCRVKVRAGWRARCLWQRRRRQHLIILQSPVGLSASFVLCRFICSLSCPCRHHENHTKHRHLLQVLLGTTHRRLRLIVADFGSAFHGHSALKDNNIFSPCHPDSHTPGHCVLKLYTIYRNITGALDDSATTVRHSYRGAITTTLTAGAARLNRRVPGRSLSLLALQDHRVSVSPYSRCSTQASCTWLVSKLSSHLSPVATAPCLLHEASLALHVGPALTCCCQTH